MTSAIQPSFAIGRATILPREAACSRFQSAPGPFASFGVITRNQGLLPAIAISRMLARDLSAFRLRRQDARTPRESGSPDPAALLDCAS